MIKFFKMTITLIMVAGIVSCDNSDSMQLSSGQKMPDNKITIEEAQQDLEKLLNDLYGGRTRNGESVIRTIENAFSLTVGNPLTRSGKNSSEDIYVFNFSDNKGYAIMANDKSVPSLLALCEEGHLSKDDEIDNPGVVLFLENIENNYYKKPVIKPEDPTKDHYEYTDWENTVYTHQGVCPVKWGQKNPHNKYCPLIDGQPTVTGCVATAIAQLFACYSYPNSYNGHSFDWEKMLASPWANDCALAGQNCIADLMTLLGGKENLDNKYGINESGADKNNIIKTLGNFGYSNPGSLIDYNTNSVVSELKAGYPVLARGYSNKKDTYFLGIKIKSSYSGGHTWLMHGLLERHRQVMLINGSGRVVSSTRESKWYPLCNWGANGNRDGYYLSEMFDVIKGATYPDSEASTRSDLDFNNAHEYYYQFDLQAVVGIRK